MKKQFWITVKQFLLYLLLSQGIMILGLVTVAIQASSMGINNNQDAVSKFVSETTIAQWAVALGFALAIVVFLGKRYVRISTGRIKRSTWGMVAFMAALASLGWMFTEVSTMLLVDFDKLFPGEVEGTEQQISNLTSELLGAISVGLLAPIAEEIGFRGVLLGGLLRMRCKPWVAIVLAAIVFALFHGMSIRILGTTVFGIITGWLYWRTRSLIPGIIAHVVNNSTAVALGFLPSEYEPSKQACVICLVVSLLMLVIGLRWFKQGRYLSRA